MPFERIQPSGWTSPKGYANGLVAPSGSRLVFIAGQVAWDPDQRLVGAGDFAAQFRQALSNVVEVVRCAGGNGEDLAQLTVFVTDKRLYAGATRELKAIWMEVVGPHYPTMALVEVAGLLEDRALVEIQGCAVIGPESGLVRGQASWDH